MFTLKQKKCLCAINLVFSLMLIVLAIVVKKIYIKWNVVSLIIVAIFFALIFSIVVLKSAKTNFWSILRKVVLIFLLIAIAMSVKVMITNNDGQVITGQISLSRCEIGSSVDTIEKWMIYYGSQGMDGNDFGQFTKIVLYPMLKASDIIIDNSLRGDSRIATLNSYLNIVEYKDLSLLEFDSAQHESFILLKTDDSADKLHIVTEEITQTSTVSYIVSDEENSIWVIPSKSGIDIYENMSGETIPRSSIVNGNLLYLCVLFFVGFCVMLIGKYKIELPLRILLSIPMGTVVEVFVVFLYGILGIPVMSISLYGSLAIIALMGVLWGSKRHGINYGKNKVMAILAIAAVFFSIIFFSLNPCYFMSYDSVENVFWGKYIALNAGFGEAFGSITAYSLFLPLVFSGASMLGISFLYSYVPVLTVSLTLALFFCLMKIVNYESEMGVFNKMVVVGIAMTFMMLTPIFILSAVWVMNNLAIGLYFGLAIILAFISELLKEKIFAYIGLTFFLLSSCARIEGPIFGMLMICFLTQVLAKSKMVKLYALSLATLAGILFFKQLLSNYNFSSDFWSVDKGIMVLAVVLLGMMYVLLREKLENARYVSFIYSKFSQLVIIGLLIVGILLAIFEPMHFLVNFMSFVAILFGNGNYGVFWLICGLLIIYIYIIKPNKTVLCLGNSILCYLLTIFDLMMFRVSYLKPHYGDSACRMILHIMPVAVLFVVELLIAGDRINPRAYQKERY